MGFPRQEHWSGLPFPSSGDLLDPGIKPGSPALQANSSPLGPLGLPQWLSGKESDCNAGDMDSIPGLGRSPEGGHSNPLQYSCLENPMDRGAWRAIVHRVTKSWIWLEGYIP